jgi:hypothetical protein
LAKDNTSAATSLMCDLAKYHMGRMSMDDIRKHWAKGKYVEAPEAWALKAIAHAKRQK